MEIFIKRKAAGRSKSGSIYKVCPSYTVFQWFCIRLCKVYAYAYVVRKWLNVRGHSRAHTHTHRYTLRIWLSLNNAFTRLNNHYPGQDNKMINLKTKTKMAVNFLNLKKIQIIIWYFEISWNNSAKNNFNFLLLFNFVEIVLGLPWIKIYMSTRKSTGMYCEG